MTKTTLTVAAFAAEDHLINPAVVRILLVEDDLFARAMLSTWLHDDGFVVTETSNVTEARAALESGQHDLALVDVLLGHGSGLELCRWLREQPWGDHLPVIVLTGIDEPDVVAEAFEAGATDFMRKPLEHGILLHRTRFALRAATDRATLAASRASLAEAQRIAQIGSFEINLANDHLIYSAEFGSLLGESPESGQLSLERFLAAVVEEDRVAVERLYRLESTEPSGGDAVFRVQTDGTEIKWFHGRARRHGDRVIGTVQDITRDRQRDENIEYLANYDKVSNLLSPRALERQIEIAVADGSGALLYVGIEDGEALRAGLGVDRFEELVKVVAGRLQRWRDEIGLNCDAVLARLGGLDFGVLLPGCDAAVANESAHRLRTFVSGVLPLGDGLLRRSFSVGIAVGPGDGDDAGSLIRAAGAARQVAARSGSGIASHTSILSDDAEQRFALEGELERAVHLQQLTLHYQPQVDGQGRLQAVEALLRWQHPTRGWISPGVFIPIAEHSGLIVPLGRWVLDQAIAQAAIWYHQGHPLRVAINLSAAQLRDPDLVSALEDRLAVAGIPASLVEIELTETALVEDDLVSRVLSDVTNLGVQIALDDFGTGYASLARVTTIALDQLKIDRSFVASLPEARSLAAIESVVSLARGLGMNVVAEGVETEAQRDQLLDLGVDLLQGYLIQRPGPAEHIKFSADG